MKALLRSTVFYALGLFFLEQLVGGVHIASGLITFILGGFFLTLLLLILKPILNMLSFPLNIVTLGLFSALSNAIILYILTLFAPGITVSAFTFPGLTFFGFVIPAIYFNQFFAFLFAASMLAIIISFIEWLIE